MKQESVDLIELTGNVRKLFLELNGKSAPFAEYYPYSDVIIVVVIINYNVPKQCPGKSPLVLFEENCKEPGMKPIAGFEIKNIRGLCRKYHISPADGTLKISEFLQALKSDNPGLCGEVAIQLATELIHKHRFDEIEFVS